MTSSTSMAFFSLILCVAATTAIDPRKKEYVIMRRETMTKATMDTRANVGVKVLAGNPSAVSLRPSSADLADLKKEQEKTANPHHCSDHIGHATHQAADELADLLADSGVETHKMHELMLEVDRELEAVFDEFAEGKCNFTASDIERELRDHRLPVDQTEIAALITRTDHLPHDGKITFHEFEKAIEKGTEHNANSAHEADADEFLTLAHEISEGTNQHNSSFTFHKHEFLRDMHEIDHELAAAFEVIDDDDHPEMTEAHLHTAGFTTAEVTQIMHAAHDGASSHDKEISLREFEVLMDEGLCHKKHSHTSEEHTAVHEILNHLNDTTDSHNHGIDVHKLIKEVEEADHIIEVIFDTWDTDDDGVIEEHEMITVLKTHVLDWEPLLSEARTIFSHVDADADGSITILEFDRMLEAGAGVHKHHSGVHQHDTSGAEMFIKGAEKAASNHSLEQHLKVELHHQHVEIKEIYNALNTEATEEISEAKLEQKLTAAGHSSATATARQIMQACDENTDGEMDLDEFEECMEMGTRHHDRGHAHFHTPSPTR